MDITGLSLGEFRACTRDASYSRYGANLITHQDRAGDVLRVPGHVPHCRARLAVRDPRGPGSRTAAALTSRGSRRHGPWACWHAYRDVLALAFQRFPDAVIKAGSSWRVTYRGQEGFLEAYSRTGHAGMGSAACPVTMPELCQCPDTVRDTILVRVPLLTCPSCGAAAGQFTSARTLAAHASRQHQQDGYGWARTARDKERHEQAAAIEELLSDPVFGPRVTRGSHFGC
jgi:hypothetical protein